MSKALRKVIQLLIEVVAKHEMSDLGRKRRDRMVEELCPSDPLHSVRNLSDRVAEVLGKGEVSGGGEGGEEEVAVVVHGGIPEDVMN